jgi:hypothetical protein
MSDEAVFMKLLLQPCETDIDIKSYEEKLMMQSVSIKGASIDKNILK